MGGTATTVAEGNVADRFEKRWRSVSLFPGWKDFPKAKLASTFLQRHGQTLRTAHLYGNNAVLVDSHGQPKPMLPKDDHHPGGANRKASLCVLCLDAMLKKKDDEGNVLAAHEDKEGVLVLTEFGKTIDPLGWTKALLTNAMHSADSGGGTAFNNHCVKVHQKDPDVNRK